MRNVELSYAFAARPQESWVRNGLVDLLHAVQEHGSISGAAKVLGLSYRHVWGELRRWEAELAHPLIVWEKGQRARSGALRREAAVGRAAGAGAAGAADRGPALRAGTGLCRGVRRFRAGADPVREP
jgi:molybdate transport repressor ModE-like protein